MPAAAMLLTPTVFGAVFGAQPRPQCRVNGVGAGDMAEAGAVKVKGVGSGGGGSVGRRSNKLI